MAWIELHDTLPDHPKTVAAAHALRIDKDMLAGKLMRLWTWALRNRLSGYLSAADAGTIAEIMRWDKKPAALIRALCTPPKGYDHGFLEPADDGGYLIHDWDVYTSQFRAQDTLRKKDRERKKAAKGAAPPARKREKLSAGIPAEQTRNSSPYQYPTLREEEEEEEEEDVYALAHAGERRGDDGKDRGDEPGDDGEDRRDDRAAALAGSPVDACIGTPSVPGEQARPARPPHSQTAGTPAAGQSDAALNSQDATPSAWQQVTGCHEAEIGPIGAGTYLRTLRDYTAQIGADAVCLAIESTNLAQPKQPSALLLHILEDWQAAGVRDAVSARKHLQSRSHRQAACKPRRKPSGHGGRPKPPPIDQLPEDYNPYYQAFWG